jgi:hypothetical protein
MTRAIRTSVAAVVMLGASLLLAPSALGGTISVNCDQTALQPKLTHAPTGSTIVLSGTCHGTFVVSKDLTLKGNPTATLDGGSGGSTLTVMGARSLHLRSLVVMGGLAERGAGIDQEGGGLLTLDHVTVRGNQAAGPTAVGGGIVAKDAVVAIRSSSLLNNSAVSSGSGLAVAQAGAVEMQNGSLTISNSVVHGNKATAVSTTSLAEADGGAVFAFETTTSVSSSRFGGNIVSSNAAQNSSAQAGALLWQQEQGDLTITDSTFTNNRAAATSDGTHVVDALAGALKVSTGTGPGTSVVEITRTTFDGNQTSATASAASAVAQGGAAFLEGGTQVVHLGSVHVMNSTLSATGATKATATGGGLDAAGHLAFAHSTVSVNTVHAHSIGDAASAGGGGITLRGPGATTIATSTISNNTADADSDNSGSGAGGGGIEVVGAARLGLRMSTVNGNTATASASLASAEALGGGIALQNATAMASDTVTNSTISGNHVSVTGPNSDSAGAGIEVVDMALALRFSTVARNGATASGSGTLFAGGGGLDIEQGTTTVVGTILALNTGAMGPNCLGPLTSNGFNLLGPTTNCTFGALGTDQPDVATPKLGKLTDNGGPTPTVRLLLGSPALDKVPTATCHAVVKMDQRLVNRPQGPKCDEGAFERKV